MKDKWIQTVIIFVEDNTDFLEREYEKTFKKMIRFYLLSSYNYFKVKNPNKCFKNYEKLNQKIKEKTAIHKYFSKLCYGM